MGNCTTTSSHEIKVNNNLVAELNTYEVKRKEYEADCKEYETDRAVLVRDIDIFESDLDTFYSTNKDKRIKINNNIVNLKHLINTLPLRSSDKEELETKLTFYENELASVDAMILEIHKTLIHSNMRLKILDAQNARRQVIT
jgi:hypothetical protein